MTSSAHTFPKVHRSWLLTSAIFAVLMGLLLLQHYGHRFVFAHADAYETAGRYVVLLCTPVVFYWMKGSKLFAAEFGKRYPTSWVRRRVVMPLSALALVAGVIAAPLGWIFAAVAWSGGDVQQVRATMVEVEEFVERRKGCDQEATLRLGLVVKATCLDGMVPPNSIRAGQEVNVGIQKAKLGILIVSIGAADRQASNLR